MIKLALCIVAWLLVLELAQAAEPCAVAPGEPRSEWHYRTQVPGFAKGAKGDRCWYLGPAMKPRSELFWDLTAPDRSVPAHPIHSAPTLDERFHTPWKWTDPSGWSHQE